MAADAGSLVSFDCHGKLLACCLRVSLVMSVIPRRLCCQRHRFGLVWSVAVAGLLAAIGARGVHLGTLDVVAPQTPRPSSRRSGGSQRSHGPVLVRGNVVVPTGTSHCNTVLIAASVSATDTSFCSSRRGSYRHCIAASSGRMFRCWWLTIRSCVKVRINPAIACTVRTGCAESCETSR